MIHLRHEFHRLAVGGRDEQNAVSGKACFREAGLQRLGERLAVMAPARDYKRLLDDALRSRSPEAQERECRLRVLTHNVMILAA